jgi:hypothetical protein
MTRTTVTLVAILAGAAALGLSGCGGRAALDGDAWRDLPYEPDLRDLPAVASVDCARAGRPAGGGVLRLALPGAVDPLRAPLPRTEAERHVFATVYETLVRLDCDGRAVAGLATTWRAYDEGRVWVFTLREGATFSDGSPVTVGAVAAAWRRAEILCAREGEPTPFQLFGPGDVESPGPGTIMIRLRTASDELPWLLTHPALAVVGRPGPGGWLAGSGPARAVPRPDPASIALEPAADHPRAPAWDRLEIRTDAPQDPRDLLAAGYDLVLSRDRQVRDYYAAAGGARIEALPWDRWYYLVVPPEPTEEAEQERRRWTTGWDRLELAREVGRETAEPAPFFAHEPPNRACAAIPPRVPVWPRAELAPDDAQGRRDRDLVLWPAGDDEAGLIAERLAVIAARPIGPGPDLPSRGPLTRPIPPAEGVAPAAAAVAPGALAAHVQAARAGAVVLPWPRRWPTPCAELARLLSLAEWLRDTGLDATIEARPIPPGARAANPVDAADPLRTGAIAQRLERSRTVQPLVRTRAHAILAPGLVGPAWNHDGTLRLETLGRSSR